MAAPRRKGAHPVKKVPAPIAPGPPSQGGSPADAVHAPFVPASANVAEVTVKAVVLGMVLSILLGAANTYLGLKAGITFAAAIPAAVVSLAVLRLFRRHTILENNMVQTIASAGSAVAAGMLFTIPALLILGAWESVHYVETTLIGVVGGLLGVFFTVPLRRALIVEENLAFPEGVATAEVLKSGENAASGVGALILGGIVGLVYKLFQGGFHLWSEGVLHVQRFGQAVTGIGAHLSVALMGVGYIIGLRVATIVFAGSVFTWMVAMPILSGTQGTGLADGIPEGDACFAAVQAYDPLAKTAGCIYKFQARYIGVGAMLVGGMYSLYKLRGPLWRAVTRGMGGARGATTTAAPVRTEVDLSPRVTFSGVGILLIPMFFFYAFVAAPAGAGLDMAQWNYGVAAVMALIMLVTGFLFSAVGAYMAGIVGSSNNPISGVTILTLIVAALSLKALGIAPDIGAEATIFVAAVIAIGGSIASDNLQDLKAGYLLGATPKRQQAMIAIGAVVSALFLAPILNVLITGPPDSEQARTLAGAPQANLMASISGGIFDPAAAGLPYPLVGIGVLLALLLVVLDQTLGKKDVRFRIPIMAVAVGMYLPIDATAPIFLGGLVAYATARLFRRRTGTDLPEGANRGVLFASGLIAGEALLGILTATLAGITAGVPTGPFIPGATIDYGCDGSVAEPCNAGMHLWLSNGTLAWPGLVLLGYAAFLMGYVVLRKARPRQP